MSDGARRLNRSNIRPQLLAKKQSQNQANNDNGDRLPADLAGNAAIVISSPGAGSRDEPSRKRLNPSVRPGFRDHRKPDPSNSMVEGEWEQTAVQSKSSANLWGLILVLLIVLAWGAGFLVGFQTSLAVLLAIGLILVIAGLISPALGLLAIGMVAALNSMANIFLLTGGLLRYNTLNYLLLLVILLNIPLILRLNDLSSRALQLLLLVMTVELAFSKDISNGVQDILNIGATFGMVAFFAKALKDEVSLYWLGIVNGVLTGLGGLVFFLQMNSLPYANPNDWTYFPLTGLFSICISYPFAIKLHKNRLILLFLAVINFAWIFLSASRGSLLVALIAGAFLFLSTRSITWKTIMIVIVVAAAVWVSASFAEQQIATVTRIQELFDPTLSPTKRTSKRSVIADAGWQIFQKNPMGIGTGSFESASAQTGLLARDRPAHSAWVQVLAENGVLGILLMTLFVGSYALVGFRRHSEGKLLFALFITMILASAFIAKEFRGKSLWFLAAGGIVLLHPRAILAYFKQKEMRSEVIYSEQLRRVRFGRRR